MNNFSKMILIVECAMFLASTAMASRHSLYDVRFNLDWKFAVGTQNGMEAKSFNDASWETVSVPHSATYAAPVHSAEQKAIGATVKSDFCYRKKFYCPQPVRKMFIHFGAIMQTATVYVNGTAVGSHNHSGYIAFTFDISNAIVRGDTNVVAVRCNAGNDGSIPPGGDGSQMPDYELFSGMYRDVYLICKDSVYVPVRGQKITTTSSAMSAATTVTNETSAPKNVSLTMAILDGTVVKGTTTATASIPAKGSSVISASITPTGITPWSPSTPKLYSVQTIVSLENQVVDSVAEKIGFRSFAWSGAGNASVFSVNGSPTRLKGVCLAQFMGWVLNAVPESRFIQQVTMIKAMGMNSVRCAHYPRSQAFYDACDSLGMLVMCEAPSWGCGGSFEGNTAFWNHMYSCDTAMVLEAFNHPSIYAWVMFNEATENTLQEEIGKSNTIIHALDPVSGSGRVTLVANIAGGRYTFDILGMNYEESSTTSGPCVNTEAYGNAMKSCDPYGDWYRNYVRGNAMDEDMTTSCSEATIEDNTLSNKFWGSSAKLAGAHFWCFMDYSSGRNTVGREGLVDRLWLPKNVYFKMRSTYTGKAADYWKAGTPAKLELTADQTTLVADGSDLSLITATLRDANNACVQANCNITFTASPASSVRLLYGGHSTSLSDSGNPVTVAAEGGRAAVLLRTSRTAGAITVSATASCVSSTPSVSLTSTLPSPEKIGPFAWSESATRPDPLPVCRQDVRLGTVYTESGALISLPAGTRQTVRLYDSRGRQRATYTLNDGVPSLVDTRSTGRGIFYAVWENDGLRNVTRLNLVR
jgi:hypothetical protein